MKVAFASDLHFVYANYGKIDPGTGIHSRYLDWQRTWVYVVDKVLEEECDALVIAGDIFRNNRPHPLEISTFVQGIKGLWATGTPVVIVAGNHDQDADGKSPALELLDAFGVPSLHIYTRPDIKELQTRAGTLQVAVLPWPSRAQLLAKTEKSMAAAEINTLLADKLVQIIRALEIQRRPDLPSILVGHLSVGGAITSSEQILAMVDEALVPMAAFEEAGFDAVCLGHIHKAQVLRPAAPWVAYGGSLERVDFGEEKEDKGFWILDVEPGRVEARFEKVPCRTFATIQCDLTGEDPVKAEEKLATAIDAASKDGSLQDAVVRVKYRATAEQARYIKAENLSEMLYAAGAFYVAGIFGDVEREERTRVEEIKEGLGVLDALKLYLANQGIEDDKIPAILECAEGLLQVAAGL